MADLKQIEALLEGCSSEEQQQIFAWLRKQCTIHPFEKRMNASAEVILEALDRASDLTIRGIRGIIAEAAFAIEIAGKLHGWESEALKGNPAFDVALSDAQGAVRIQVKMQRQEKHQPLLKGGMYVVETQKTRGGTKEGQQTRPYKFGEFDILAVCMEPSTKSWASFRYTVAQWLLPRPEDAKLMRVLQPVPLNANDDWTDDLLTCIKWFRSNQKKTITEPRR